MNYSTNGLVPVQNHGDVIINIIWEHQFHKVAEIGVYEGGTIKRILNNLKMNAIVKEYWAIDQWQCVPKEYGSWSDWDQATWDAKHLKTVKRMRYFPALKVVKMTSVKAAKIFEDGYFDLIYIDGSHLYDDVVLDLNSWLPKVRKGGILSGHDYLHRDGKGRRSRCEVKPAVDDILGKDNIQLEMDNVWIFKVK